MGENARTSVRMPLLPESCPCLRGMLTDREPVAHEMHLQLCFSAKILTFSFQSITISFHCKNAGRNSQP
jgi:hypothetical protein